MKLKKDNRIPWELSDLEIVNGFINSQMFKNASRELHVRLALYIAFDEPKGLQSVFVDAKEFTDVLDLLYLQLKLKRIDCPTFEIRVRRKNKPRRSLNSLNNFCEI